MAHSVARAPTYTQEDDGVPTNKQRRATAKRKLERQLEKRAQQARRRRIATIAALAAVVIVVAGLAVWTVFFKKSSRPHADGVQPDQLRRANQPRPTHAAPQAGVLPPFKPPADLGANCQYPATPNEPAAKKANPPTDREGTDRPGPRQREHRRRIRGRSACS